MTRHRLYERPPSGHSSAAIIGVVCVGMLTAKDVGAL